MKKTGYFVKGKEESSENDNNNRNILAIVPGNKMITFIFTRFNCIKTFQMSLKKTFCISDTNSC